MTEGVAFDWEWLAVSASCLRWLLHAITIGKVCSIRAETNKSAGEAWK